MAEADSACAAFFDGSPLGWGVCCAVKDALDTIGAHEVRVGRSQIAFRRAKGFAYLWRPARYVHTDVPAVLSLALAERLSSSRFKEVVHPAPSVWMHHLELRSPDQLDDEVRGWLARAYAEAA